MLKDYVKKALAAIIVAEWTLVNDYKSEALEWSEATIEDVKDKTW